MVGLGWFFNLLGQLPAVVHLKLGAANTGEGGAEAGKHIRRGV
jgi:hypothetical protein